MRSLAQRGIGRPTPWRTSPRVREFVLLVLVGQPPLTAALTSSSKWMPSLSRPACTSRRSRPPNIPHRHPELNVLVGLEVSHALCTWSHRAHRHPQEMSSTPQRLRHSPSSARRSRTTESHGPIRTWCSHAWLDVEMDAILVRIEVAEPSVFTSSVSACSGHLHQPRIDRIE